MFFSFLNIFSEILKFFKIKNKIKPIANSKPAKPRKKKVKPKVFNSSVKIAIVHDMQYNISHINSVKKKKQKIRIIYYKT